MNDVVLQMTGPVMLPASPEQAQLLAAQQRYMLAAQQRYMHPAYAMYNPGMMFMGPQVLNGSSKCVQGFSTCAAHAEWEGVTLQLQA